MGRQPVTEAGQAMLDVLRRHADGAYEVADAFTPLIERRAAQTERRRILEAIARLPTRNGNVDLNAVLAAIEAANEE
jgi:hypothetical protein